MAAMAVEGWKVVEGVAVGLAAEEMGRGVVEAKAACELEVKVGRTMWEVAAAWAARVDMDLG